MTPLHIEASACRALLVGLWPVAFFGNGAGGVARGVMSARSQPESTTHTVHREIWNGTRDQEVYPDIGEGGVEHTRLVIYHHCPCSRCSPCRRGSRSWCRRPCRRRWAGKGLCRSGWRMNQRRCRTRTDKYMIHTYAAVVAGIRGIRGIRGARETQQYSVRESCDGVVGNYAYVYNSRKCTRKSG